jgi:hypothetical protein
MQSMMCRSARTAETGYAVLHVNIGMMIARFVHTSARKCLPEKHHVGTDTVVLMCEHLARAAKTLQYEYQHQHDAESTVREPFGFRHR